MPHVRVTDVADYVGQEIEIRGWLYNKSHKGKLYFLQVRDGSQTIQGVVFKPNVRPEVFELADRLTQECSIVVTGTVKEDKRSPIGFEIDVTDLALVGESPEFPITPKEHGVDFLMGNRHLWLRSKRQHAILLIRDEIVRAIRDYFHENGFVLIDAPVFTPSACEGTTNLFETEYFGEKAYLTQSGQLYMEAGAMAFGKVYCFGPTFRAEKSKTRRHLTEFWMVEPEVAYFDLAQDMDLAEDFVTFIVGRVLENRRLELAELERDISALEKIKKPFARITYSEAVEILKNAGNPFEWGDDFGGDEETIVSQNFETPVLIHRYPAEVKAFYMKRDPEDERLALCVDMIAPEGYGEIIGGGQREDDLGVLEAAIDKHGLPQEAFAWYKDLRRYGTVPHAGFGLGVERTVAWMCGIHHVRETIPFPRLMGRVYP